MLNEYIKDNNIIKEQIKDFQSQINDIESVLKPIEEQLKPYYDMIKGFKDSIKDLNESLYKGYYMEVKTQGNELTTWLEQIGDLTHDRKVGQLNYNTSFKQISNKESFDDVYRIALDMINKFNSNSKNQGVGKRELVSVINFTKGTVYDGSSLYDITNYIK